MDSDDVRIGVYVCHCGLNIAAVVDCAQVAEASARALNKHVVIIKNGRGVGILDGLCTLLTDGDSVSIMPAVGGG